MAAPGAGPNSLPRGKSPFATRDARLRALRFGLWLFVVSLAMLFAASVIGYVVIRIQTADDQPLDLPALPKLLWLSTLVLALGSATIQRAVVEARRDRRGPLLAALLASIFLGLLFLGLQGVCWWQWLQAIADRWDQSDAYRIALAGFYVFTGVHALHVLGGLVALLFTTARAAGRADPEERHASTRAVALYWHFLGIVWVILFATLLLGS